jgi:hypothetical protein
MADLDQFAIQRELLTVEEKLLECKSSFCNYLNDDTPEKREFDAALKKVRSLQSKMRRFFAE